MPNVKPIKYKTIGFNDNLVIESGAMDFNEFNLGCISEKYSLIGLDIFTSSKEQLTQLMGINYIDANGNEKIFRKAPRIDSYQLSDAINCIDIPNVPCDGLNRFEYTVLPNTEALVTFKVDKRNTATQILKQSIQESEDQNNVVLDDLYDGYDAPDVLPNNLTEKDEIKKASKVTVNDENFYLKHIVNVNINNTKGYINASGVENKPIKYNLLKNIVPFIVFAGVLTLGIMAAKSINSDD